MFCSGIALAQNTFPTIGKAGINTTTPAEALHVRGDVRVDSSMTVQDSIIVNGRTRTFELIVQGDSKFIGDVVMKQLLKVDGDIKAKANVDIDGMTKMTGNAKAMADFQVDGTSKLQGSVKMTGIGTTSPVSGMSLIVKLPSGQLKTVDFSYLAGLFGAVELITSCPPDTDVPVPQWIAGFNKLYNDCNKVRVGIGTAYPEFKLDVKGSTFTASLKVGNVTASETALINGFVLNNTQNLIALGKKVGADAEEMKFKITNDGATEITNSGTDPSLTINNGTGSALKVFSNEGIKILELLNNGTLVLKSQSGPIFSMFSSDGTQVLRLEDNGMLRSRQIKVDLSTWADNVFEDDYVLILTEFII